MDVLRSLTPFQRAAFAALTGAMAVSLGGSLLIRFVPEAAGWIGAWYVTLVKVPTWTWLTAMPVLAFALYLPREGLRRMLGFMTAGTLIGGACELVGTATGYPFGEYLYTAWLGPTLFGHVPWFIPPMWFAMTLVSFDLAGRLIASRWGRILMTAMLMVLWDVSLGPAMSLAFPFWSYPEGGGFFGMPLTNLFGWFVASALIAAAYEFLVGGPVKPHRAGLLYYLLNCAFPFLLSLVFGLAGAAATGLVATGAVWLAVNRRTRHGLTGGVDGP